MLSSAAVSKSALMLRHLRALSLAATVAVAAPACLAAPDGTASPTAGDAILGLLQERGLIATGEGTLVQSVRDRASELVLSAMNFLGVPYRRGGQSEEGFDCSGFTRHIFELSVGLVLPRRADEQAQMPGLLSVTRDDLKPGDLVFFNTLRRSFSHVGIYVGDGKFIHSPRAGGAVRVEDMRIAYWAQRFNGARRAPLAAASDAGTPPTVR